MENKDIILGSHVSMSSPDFFLGSVKEALEYGATTLMLYTGAPQNSNRIPVSRLKVEEAKKLALESGLDINKFVCHAPYLINLCNPDPFKREVSQSFLLSEIARTNEMGLSVIVLHPGCHMKAGDEEGLLYLIKSLQYVLSADNSNVKIALETMAGKGSEVCTNLSQLKYVLEQVDNDRLGVCLDTCHMHDAGYDLNDYESWKDEIKNTITLDKVFAIHVNDSKNVRGAHKDRHENLGYGYIGFDILNKVVHDEDFANVAKILETPYYEGNPPYKKEIQMLRNGKYIEGWRE